MTPINKSTDLPRLDQFDFHHRMEALTGTSLVMFSSPDCGGCRYLRQVLRAVRRRRPDWRVFEVDAQRDQALTHEFEVFHLPTLFLFHNGAYHCELQAEANPTDIVAATQEALNRVAEEAP